MVQRCVKVIRKNALTEDDLKVYLNEFKIMTMLVSYSTDLCFMGLGPPQRLSTL